MVDGFPIENVGNDEKKKPLGKSIIRTTTMTKKE
jgi:hypothetical protein